jgi:hypothetical protein
MKMERFVVVVMKVVEIVRLNLSVLTVFSQIYGLIRIFVLPHVLMGILKTQQVVLSAIQHVFNVLLVFNQTSVFLATIP